MLSCKFPLCLSSHLSQCGRVSLFVYLCIQQQEHQFHLTQCRLVVSFMFVFSPLSRWVCLFICVFVYETTRTKVSSDATMSCSFLYVCLSSLLVVGVSLPYGSRGSEYKPGLSMLILHLLPNHTSQYINLAC